MHPKYTEPPPRIGHSGPIPRSILERLLAKTKYSGSCWLWTGGLWSNGYGKLRIGSMVDGSRTEVLIHRLSYEMHKGPVPEGMKVCHECDVRNCWNPDHLFPGTAKDNNDDCHRKGRHAHGDTHPARIDPSYFRRGLDNPISKLTDQAATEIRNEYRPVYGSITRLARKHGVSVGAVQAILKRRTWKHVA